jgi:hypothetical protein
VSAAQLPTGNPETAALLPPAGEGRWWLVEHNPKSRTNPITVKLMESMSGNRRALSRPIGYEYTIADAKQVAKAAEVILARVGDYVKVVGSYGGE